MNMKSFDFSVLIDSNCKCSSYVIFTCDKYFIVVAISGTNTSRVAIQWAFLWIVQLFSSLSFVRRYSMPDVEWYSFLKICEVTMTNLANFE